MKKTKIILLLLAVVLMTSCSDDGSFSTSQDNRLTFSTDTLRLDTLFSNVPSATKSLWVYNNSGDGVRCSSIRLERGSSSGFRVNVDGIYLSEGINYQTAEVEIRNKDSIRVFVEATLPTATAATPTYTDDNLIFTLESGVEQRINLNAWAWNARQYRNVEIVKDSTINSDGTPIIIYGGLKVDSLATLTLAAGTTLYFHPDAGMNVYGRLVSQGTADNNVVLRGDRIDKMFDYLPYDRVPAQWQGVHFYGSSYGNELNYTDIHSANTGVEIDSSDVARQKLTLSHSTVHNNQGYGLHAVNAKLTINDSQITNSLNDVVGLVGGDVDINNSTLAQFYPFDSRRGAALAFSESVPITRLNVLNTLITGYADDEMTAIVQDTATTKNWHFDHCIIRTPRITTRDSLLFNNVIYEDVSDTTSMGRKHFVKVDIDNQDYDFRLSSSSAAIGKADPQTALPDDRLGVRRDDNPDVGAYEYTEK